MKRTYKVPIGRLQDYKHPHPDRTAYKNTGVGMDFDVTCQIWTSREAMLQACHMSDTGELGNKPWKPLVKEC